MEREIFSEPPTSANHAHEFEHVAKCVIAQIRGGLIHDKVQAGFSPTGAENFVDFIWIARGWPLCDAQRQNIESWSKN